MGYVEQINDIEHTIGDRRRTPFIYNVRNSVGHNGVNAASDVRMVQYLLNIVKPVIGKAGRDDLKLDGKCGPKTIEMIRTFQAVCARLGNASEIKVDGRFDSVPNHSFFTPSHRRRYTLIVLNGQARMADIRRYRQLWQFVHLEKSEHTDQMENWISFRSANQMGLRIPAGWDY